MVGGRSGLSLRLSETESLGYVARTGALLSSFFSLSF